MFRFSESVVTLPDFPKFGFSDPQKIRGSDMADSPNFYSSEIGDSRFADFCVHTARFSGNLLQKVGQLEKIGQWDHRIRMLLKLPRFCSASGMFVEHNDENNMEK